MNAKEGNVWILQLKETILHKRRDGDTLIRLRNSLITFYVFFLPINKDEQTIFYKLGFLRLICYLMYYYSIDE